jgi:hypothetical protein
MVAIGCGSEMGEDLSWGIASMARSYKGWFGGHAGAAVFAGVTHGHDADVNPRWARICRGGSRAWLAPTRAGSAAMQVPRFSQE